MLIHYPPSAYHENDAPEVNYCLNPKLILMKTLKITLLLAAVVLLTVSGSQSDGMVNPDNQNDVKQTTKTDLLAHTKKGLKLPTTG